MTLKIDAHCPGGYCLKKDVAVTLRNFGVGSMIVPLLSAIELMLDVNEQTFPALTACTTILLSIPSAPVVLEGKTIAAPFELLWGNLRTNVP